MDEERTHSRPSQGMLFNWGKSANSNLFSFGRRSWIIPSESQSTEEYLETKKKDHLARKKLSAFIHLFEHCSMEHIEGHRKGQNPTNRNGEDANCQFQRGLVDNQSGTACNATIGKEGKEKVVKENRSEREPEKQRAQLSDCPVPDYNIGSASSENTEVSHVEGVSKFSSTAGGNIPWKEILDLDSSVFLNCRTSVD
ncbi:hypothetical protein SLEP1_g36717 [Rubroshorea leprosula]|uniref:Uncharacterized protein n=1 Tax=Rubroshorea leprosula TaxID=152421 RepID=A0AAV5KSD6_9ROSI|nr:hypothetical protein SLEP1_g36717 [Rubroshorea leprosula]